MSKRPLISSGALTFPFEGSQASQSGVATAFCRRSPNTQRLGGVTHEVAALYSRGIWPAAHCAPSSQNLHKIPQPSSPWGSPSFGR